MYYQGTMRRVFVLVGLVALACQDTATAPLELEPVLSARALWSGGELRITDAAFAGQVVRVVLDHDTLPTQSLDDTTVAVRLPRRVGTFPVQVIAGSTAASAGDVTLHGFQSAMYSVAFMSGQPYAIPGGGAPLIFAGSDPGAAVFDLSTGTAIQTLPESLFTPDCIWTPSPSNDANRFVLMGKRADGSCGAAKLWSIRPTPEFIDSLAAGAGTTWYTSGQPSPRRWIFNWNNNNHLWICDTGCVFNFYQSADGPDGVTISPRGDRFLWLPAAELTVYDSRTLDTAFVLPGWYYIHGAFSAEGDTLALTASEDTAEDRKHLLFVRADDGIVLRDVRLDSLYQQTDFVLTGPVAADPVRPWLYATLFVRSAAGEWTLRVVVVDRTNGAILGVLDTPVSFPVPYAPAAVVPSPLEHRVYIVLSANGYKVHGFRGTILRYSTPQN
jgi:hypothetical protein